MRLRLGGRHQLRPSLTRQNREALAARCTDVRFREVTVGYRTPMPILPTTVGAAAVLAGSVAVARLGVPVSDRSVFLQINDLPDALQYALWGPMQVGSLGASVGTGLLIGWRKDRDLGMKVAVSGVAGWLAAKALKRVAGRERPGATIASTTMRIGAADSGLGFPSGHAALAMTTAISLGRSAPPTTGAFLLALAAIAGVSRIYVGAHYPLDVIGGWALGVVVADVAGDLVDSLGVARAAD